jgi:hypothetical protein
MEMLRRAKQKALEFDPSIPPAYGFKIVGRSWDRKLVKDDHEQGVVREIVQMREHGMECESIARRLNEIGITGRRGGLWRGTGVAAVLRHHEPQLHREITTQILKEQAKRMKRIKGRWSGSAR